MDTLFESRKADHIRLSLDSKNQAIGASGFEQIHLFHEALPECNFSDIDLRSHFWRYEASSPCFISSMTAGHHKGESLNLCLAKIAGKKKWPMGLGSQRRELTDPAAHEEWKRLRKKAPDTAFFSNLGLTQLIEVGATKALKLVENLESIAFIIHTNPLQEALQEEGTPNFTGGLKALEKLCKNSKVPIIIKETGSGFSPYTLKKLLALGVAVIDVSGLGGTHWGRIEGGRAHENSLRAKAAETFAYWGEPTVSTLLNATKLRSLKKGCKTEIWASGGIRSGLDVAKSLAIGANKVGFAKPALEAAVLGEESLEKWINLIEIELRIALYCTGSKNINALQRGRKWQKI